MNGANPIVSQEPVSSCCTPVYRMASQRTPGRVGEKSEARRDSSRIIPFRRHRRPGRRERRCCTDRPALTANASMGCGNPSFPSSSTRHRGRPEPDRKSSLRSPTTFGLVRADAPPQVWTIVDGETDLVEPRGELRSPPFRPSHAIRATTLSRLRVSQVPGSDQYSRCPVGRLFADQPVR